MIRAVTRFAGLRPEQRRLELRAAVALLAARNGLRLAPLSAVAMLLGVRVGVSRPDGPRLPFADSRADAAVSVVDRLVERLPRRTRCIHRALLLGHLLRSERPYIRIGVRRIDGEVQAHAWVEIRGLVVAEPDPLGLSTFSTLARP
ncbi:MAG: lasso peptide biosynthesis B2 protein [Gammaproteobacteria bacterium]|nr:lasso peptide biosynthesis B2 protein [Gammaproteobacteria bacterium]